MCAATVGPLYAAATKPVILLEGHTFCFLASLPYSESYLSLDVSWPCVAVAKSNMAVATTGLIRLLPHLPRQNQANMTLTKSFSFLESAWEFMSLENQPDQ